MSIRSLVWRPALDQRHLGVVIRWGFSLDVDTGYRKVKLAMRIILISLLNRISRWIGALALASLGAAAAAQDVAPDVLVKSVASEVLEIARSDKEILAGNQKRVMDLAEEKVLPHFNFVRMTALAMGPSWRRATPEQQKLVVEQFRTLLVHTYSAGLSAYRNQTIDYKPLRSKPTDTEVIVRSEIRQSGAQAIPIDYNMEKTERGWKVFDVAIGGVSLVTTYRDTFSQEVRASGIDGLIKTLIDKNKQNAGPRK
jgi:phospholipid transport system substrate-binding protein